MTSIARTTSESLAGKRALLRSVRERIKWLHEEILAHGHSGRLDRRHALLTELRSLERTAETLNRSIKRAETTTTVLGRRAS